MNNIKVSFNKSNALPLKGRCKHYSFSEGSYTISREKKFLFRLFVIALIYIGICVALMLANNFAFNNSIPTSFVFLSGLCVVFPLLCNDIFSAIHDLYLSRYDYIEILNGKFKFKTLFNIFTDSVVFAEYTVISISDIKNIGTGVRIEGLLSVDLIDGNGELVESSFADALFIPNNFVEFEEITLYLTSIKDGNVNDVLLKSPPEDWQQFIDERNILEALTTTCDGLIQYSGIKALIQKVSKIFPAILLIVGIIIELLV